jgi:hypothetical protein
MGVIIIKRVNNFIFIPGVQYRKRNHDYQNACEERLLSLKFVSH